MSKIELKEYKIFYHIVHEGNVTIEAESKEDAIRDWNDDPAYNDETEQCVDSYIDEIEEVKEGQDD